MVSTTEMRSCVEQTIQALRQVGVTAPNHKANGAFPNGPFYNEDGITLRTDITQPLDELLMKDKLVADVIGKSCRDGGSGSHHPIAISHLVAALITTTLEAGDIDYALGQMFRVISTNTAKGAFVAVLSGIDVETEFNLGNEIRLVPFRQIPESSNKQHLLHKAKIPADATSALLVEFEISNFYFDPTQSTSSHIPSGGQVETIRRIADCLMVFTNSSSGIIAEWDLVIDVGAPRFNEVMIRLDPLVAYTSTFKSTTIKADQATQLAEAASHWLTFRGDYGQISLACARLRRSGRGMHPEDQAIDLGVALEVLLSGNLNSTQELSHRLAMRGAWLLGSDPDKRLTMAGNLKSIYDMRSKAVHTGRVSGKFKFNGKKLVAFEALEAGRELCNSMLLEIIHKREWPNWDLITFGG